MCDLFFLSFFPISLYIIIPPHGAVFGGFTSISRECILSSKELIKAEDSPLRTVQRVTTFSGSLGVNAPIDSAINTT